MDVRSFGSRFWHSDGLFSREGDGLYGLAGVSVTTTRSGETVELKADGPLLQINYLQQPGGVRYRDHVDHLKNSRCTTL